MSDLRENLEIAKHEKLLQIEELKLNIRRSELNILKSQDEIERNRANNEATAKAITELEREVTAMKVAKGEQTDG